MTSIDKLTTAAKAKVEKALAAANTKNAAQNKAQADIDNLEKAVAAPEPGPATVIPNVDKDDFVDSINVITVLGPEIEGEIVDGPAPYTKAQAEKLDKRIIAAVATAADKMTILIELVEEAQKGQIHIALGFASWTEYLAQRVQTKFADIADRQVAALMLHEEGMSNRAIASTLGVSPATTVTDIRAAKKKAEANETPAAPGGRKKSVGTDGKEYTRTAKKPTKPAPAPAVKKPEPQNKRKHTDLEIRHDLALADAENIVADIESLTTNLELLYSTPEFIAGADKDIKAHLTRARTMLANLPKAPARRKPVTTK